MRIAILIAAICGLPHATLAREAVEFCSSYVQTSSTAGTCDACRITVVESTSNRAYLIRGSNGWSAGAGWDHGPDAAEGVGMWDEGSSGKFSSAIFDAFFAESEDDTLEMIMIMRDKSVSANPIIAKYRCDG